MRDGGPSLVRIDPAGAGWRHRLDRITRIGRGFDNDMVLEDRTVSRNHAEVRFEHGDFHLVDLDSTNGVRVNGRRIKRHVLRPGDRVHFGSVEFAFDPNSD
jgi:pSer/pThr/pTyr-binding forkhead associated (FHA) protein